MSVKQRQRDEFDLEIDFAIHHNCNIKKSLYRNANMINCCCSDYKIRFSDDVHTKLMANLGDAG